MKFNRKIDQGVSFGDGCRTLRASSSYVPLNAIRGVWHALASSGKIRRGFLRQVREECGDRRRLFAASSNAAFETRAFDLFLAHFACHALAGPSRDFSRPSDPRLRAGFVNASIETISRLSANVNASPKESPIRYDRWQKRARTWLRSTTPMTTFARYLCARRPRSRENVAI